MLSKPAHCTCIKLWNRALPSKTMAGKNQDIELYAISVQLISEIRAIWKNSFNIKFFLNENYKLQK
jgi:hypothetical protein